MAKPRMETRELLLTRQGVLFVEEGHDPNAAPARAVALELAALGYVPSTRLQARLERAPLEALAWLREWTLEALAAQLGADQKHIPLFRKFPRGVPDDTVDLWVRRVLSHFGQSPEQPCLFCRRVGTTHILAPCRHVVCDRCWDGANYSACPVCGHHVDRSSPFFEPSAEAALPEEPVRFKLIDLGEDLDAAARDLFERLCARRQALSPVDSKALGTLVREYGEQAAAWVPDTIPVKENVAVVLGGLFKTCEPEPLLPLARRHLRTATDVLRFVAAFSDADPALQGETVDRVLRVVEPNRWWGKIAALLGASPPGASVHEVHVPLRVHRFRVAKLRRPLRRVLLSLLDGFDPERLTEDMLRHRSYWVWVGEFLHPHEYAKRFPTAARAFAVVRQKAPDGTLAPPFRGFAGKLEAAVQARDVPALLELLVQRPGELARRFDHALRLAQDDKAAARSIVDAFVEHVSAFSTPVLLTLRNLLPTRLTQGSVRIYWPKGPVTKGFSSPDTRPPLSADLVDPAVRAIEGELLRRFAEKPAFGAAVVDEALATVPSPFNERTASPSALALPRGSAIDVADSKVARLFLHWCQPEGGQDTDLDLSVGFYDADWNHVGVCSYYHLVHEGADGAEIAKSAGDLLTAPFPDGGSEFVDVHRDRALAAGIRYAVMVVNSYSGLPFSKLERGFAGLMLREDVGGAQFDPRTVALRFNLQGENGVYMPLVFDVLEAKLHWLDVYARGGLLFNNVASSNRDLKRVCPELIAYFASGTRISIYELALFHAASRCREVFVRGDRTRRYVREAGEGAASFLRRVLAGEGAPADLPDVDGPPVLAALHDGDLHLPPGSVCYALFPGATRSTISASDFVA